MKTSAIIVAAAAALVSANNPGDVPYSCAKANAAYCLGGDIILRCDENSVGTPGRCSDNLSGYPPAGGVATCWESSKEAGDAACAKNCIVHADPDFTLPESECKPAWTNSTTTTTVITTTLTQPSGTWFPNTTYTHPPPPPPHSTDDCSDEPTTWPTMTTTYTIPPPPGTGVPPPPGTGVPPPPGNGTGNGTTTWSHGGGGGGGSGGNPTNVPVPPTTTSPEGTVPTGAAVANRAGTVLAAAGLIAAYFI